MTEKRKETKAGLMASKYWRLFLVILMGLLTFGGPYVAYMSENFLKRGVFFSFASGFASFMVGMVLLWYLIRNGVFS
jgi:hypothetical protein